MKSGIAILVFTMIIISTVSATTVEFNPSDDGRIMRILVNQTWANIHDGAGTDNSSTPATASIQIQSSKDTNKYFWIYRNAFVFNTSSIPDDATVTSATLSLYRTATSTAFSDFGLNVVGYTGTSSFQNPDYQSFGTTIFSTEKLLSGMATTQYYDWTLNPDGIATINKTGSSSFGIRYTPDITNTEPTWVYNVGSVATFNMVESTSNKPVLEVTYFIPPTSSFTSNVTLGIPPLSVAFTDLSNETPTNWDWYWYANETKSSDDQNPSTTLTTGTYDVRLYTSNSAGGNWSNKTDYILVSPDAVFSADFVGIGDNGYLYGDANFNVSFTSTTTGTALYYNWTFGDGGTSSLANPNHIYTTAGVYDVNFTAISSVNSVSEIKNDYVTVYGAGTPHALFTATPLTGAPSLLVNFLDTSIYGTTVNRTCNWTFGDSLSTQPYSSTCGNVQHVYSYSGVYNANYSISNDNGTSFQYRDQYIVVSTSQTPNYVVPTQPKSVRFTVVDVYGTDLPGALVTVNYINSTLPSTDINWLISAFGVTSTVAGEMMNGSVAMQGTTGSEGSLSFIMYPVLQYGITITNATAGLSKYVSVYPKDDDYIIRCTLTSQVAPVSRATQLANSTIYVTEPNSSWVTFNIIYQDTSDRTTNIKWNVTNLTSRTVVYSYDFGDPGTDVMIDNFTVSTEPRGEEYRAMYDATRSW